VEGGIASTLEKFWLRPLGNLESAIILTTLLVNLFDSFTTVTLYLTHTGVELNPVLSDLLRVNPFLTYLYLASFLVVILVFRFNSIVEYGAIIILFTIHLIASVNNLGVIYYNYSGSTNLIIDGIDVQFLAFLLGVIYIGWISLYITIHRKDTRFNSIKTIFVNYFFYLMAYLIPRQ
jgi:hypothetical protein